MENWSIQDILPAVSKYVGKLCKTGERKKLFAADCSYEEDIIRELSSLSAFIYNKTNNLENVLSSIKSAANTVEEANMFRDTIIPLMNEIRKAVDEAERAMSSEYWPYPSYADLLFGIR